MSDFFFISYSSVDGKDFAFKLADELVAGPPTISIWLDKRNTHLGEDWDDQLAEAIKTCKGMIFLMSADSVARNSVCKHEWVRALKYKKPLIPILLSPDIEKPFRLESRQHIKAYRGSLETVVAEIRKHLAEMDSPKGQLEALQNRLSDAEHELPRAEPDQQARVRQDIAELERQIAEQQKIVANPAAAEQRVEQSIQAGLEIERQPARPAARIAQGRFINPPPLVAPAFFQDRHLQTQQIGQFLKDESLRLMTIVGRGGVGKTGMVCRLLRSLEGGQLPDEGGPLTVDGIVYLSAARSFHRPNLPDWYAGLCRLLPEEAVRQLDSIYKNPQATTRAVMEALVQAFPLGRTVVLLDNFEDMVEMETRQIRDAELGDALRALLELPPHGLKLIITTRVAPQDLAMVQPGLQRRIDLDSGLESPYAEKILRALDADGSAGLRDAPESLLSEACERTLGYPRALEHLYGILSNDRAASLREILDDTRRYLPEQVVSVLVGEAFSRLDLTAQRVMQALAAYRYPVTPAAVDYMLQPHVPGIDSKAVLSRLVNMQFVRRDSGRYYLHQVDREYALSRIPEGRSGDRDVAEIPGLSQCALCHRAAEWFKLSRKPAEAWKTLDDLAAQICEFDLRCAVEDYDSAALILLEIDSNYLIQWGHYRLVTDLHERLQGKIADPFLDVGSDMSLGAAYYRMGEYQRAISCFERALSLARGKMRWNEGACLGSLSSCYSTLGDTDQAIRFCEQALEIRREVGDRMGEAQDLNNLGNRYADLGQTAEAIDYYEKALKIEGIAPADIALFKGNLGNRCAELGRTSDALRYHDAALAIARDVTYPLMEAYILEQLGELYRDQGLWRDATRSFKRALEIADDIANPQCQQWARIGLAEVNLYEGEFGRARGMAEAARQCNFPLSSHRISAVLGVAALRQGDREAARRAFATGLNEASELIHRTPRLYAASDTKGLVLCGLALVENPRHLPAAKAAYQAARAINSDAGIVGRVLRLFDALALADTAGIVTEIRPVAAGTKQA